MKIAYICGSPRKESESNSALILKDLEAFFLEEGVTQESSIHISVPRKSSEETTAFRELTAEADIWVLSFPLYVDSLPGHLCRWLKCYEAFRKESERKGGNPPSPKVYGIANCGFPEAVQNREALMVLEIFCRKNGLKWCCGMGLGMGEAYKGMSSMPLRSPAKKELLAAFRALADDLKSGSPGERENIFASVRYPLFLYRLIGSLGWRFRARKYGVKYRELFNRPLWEG